MAPTPVQQQMKQQEDAEANAKAQHLRAEKLEAELTKAKNDLEAARAKSPAGVDKAIRAENEHLRGELERLRKMAEQAAGNAVLEDQRSQMEEGPMFRNGRGQLVSEKHRGTKSYIVGPLGHYRQGILYAGGSKITVTDEKPSKTWKPFEPNAKQPTAAPEPDADHPQV